MLDNFYTREQWYGDSRDGVITSGEGWHYFRMTQPGTILEAFEVYETEDGEEIVTPLPDMVQVDWLRDLGFEDLEALEEIEKRSFDRIRACHPSFTKTPPPSAA
ncbi:MAG: hypothetical protein WCI18_09170 [Pseudomonadota bacterium]